MKNRHLQTVSDTVFKRIFGQEKEIVIELINAFIQPSEPVIDLQFLPTELLSARSIEKASIVDVLCIDSLKRHFVLEVQVVKQKSFKERVNFYASRVLVQSLEKSQEFRELVPVFVLCFLDHIIEPDLEDWLHRYCQSHEKYPHLKIKGVDLIFIELAKWKKLGNFNLENAQEHWLSFLTNPEKLITMPKHELHKYPNLEKAVQLLDQSNYTPGQLLAHNNYLNNLLAWNMTMIENYDDGFDAGVERGMEKGLEKGVELGKKEGMELTTAILRNLKEGRQSIDEIAVHFSVSVDKVKEIKELLG